MTKSRICVIVSFLSIFIASCFVAYFMPVSIYGNAMHDDAHFILGSISLEKGQWLGAYNHMTLIKGPVYSIWLFITNKIGLPFQVTNQLLYLTSVFLLTLSIKKHIGGSWLVYLSLMLFLSFQPVIFTERIIRDYIYTSLLFFVISSLLFISDKFTVRNFLWVALSSVSLFLFWYTREEGLWICPLLLICIVSILKAQDKTKLIINYLLVFFLVFLFSSILSSINYKHYGTKSVVDFKDNSFKSALSALNSISVLEKKADHVPVSQHQREIAYSVSPSLALLKPYLENDNIWKNASCNVYQESCGDYAGGWFMWAIRDAVAGQGMYETAYKANDFYQRVSDEITHACENGTIRCSENAISYLPSLPGQFLKKYLSAIATGVFDISYLKTNPSWLSMGDSYDGAGENLNAQSISERFNITFRTLTKTEKTGLVSGWFYNKAKPDEWLCISVNNKCTPIKKTSSPDLVSHFNNVNAHASRFEIIPNELSGDVCLTSDMEKCIPGAQLYRMNSIGLDGGVLHVDRIVKSKLPTPGYGIAVKKILYEAYGYLNFIFIFIFMISILKGIFSKGLTFDFMTLIICLSLFGLCFFRVLILALIDVTSFPGITKLYMLPCFPLFGAGMFIGSFLLVRKVK